MMTKTTSKAALPSTTCVRSGYHAGEHEGYAFLALKEIDGWTLLAPRLDVEASGFQTLQKCREAVLSYVRIHG